MWMGQGTTGLTGELSACPGCPMGQRVILMVLTAPASTPGEVSATSPLGAHDALSLQRDDHVPRGGAAPPQGLLQLPGGHAALGLEHGDQFDLALLRLLVGASGRPGGLGPRLSRAAFFCSNETCGARSTSGSTLTSSVDLSTGSSTWATARPSAVSGIGLDCSMTLDSTGLCVGSWTNCRTTPPCVENSGPSPPRRHPGQPGPCNNATLRGSRRTR